MREGHKDGKLTFIYVAALLTLLGGILLFENRSPEIIGFSVGTLLILFGVLYAVIAFIDTARGFLFVVRIIITALFVVCGIILAIFNDALLGVLASVISLALIIDGSFKIKRAVNARRLSLEAWWVLLIPAVIAIGVGFVTLRFTLSSDVLFIILGIASIVEGAANAIALPIAISCERRAEAEIYYGVYRKDLAKNTLNKNPENNEEP